MFVFAVAVVVALWQSAGTASGAVRLLISTPSNVARYTLANIEPLLRATAITFTQAVSGLLVSTLVALALATLALRYSSLRRLLRWTAVSVQVIPLLVFAPFLVIAFGAGMLSKIVLVALICTPSILEGILAGVDRIGRSTNELLDLHRADVWFKIRFVWLPLSLPTAFLGLRVAASLAVVGSVVAEFSGAREGIGKNLLQATFRLEPELMMTSLLSSCAMGLVLYRALRVIERRVCWWS